MTSNDSYWDGFSDGRNGLTAVSDHPEYMRGWNEGRTHEITTARRAAGFQS